jgi:hypothetical protein
MLLPAGELASCLRWSFSKSIPRRLEADLRKGTHVVGICCDESVLELGTSLWKQHRCSIIGLLRTQKEMVNGISFVFNCKGMTL